MVEIDGEPLGKPRDAAEADLMLRRLSGREHRVYTGIALWLPDSRIITDYARTAVQFRELEDQEIADYIATGEPMDKAGAYGIQERGACLLSGWTGAFST
jgi:septum formation protein